MAAPPNLLQLGAASERLDASSIPTQAQVLRSLGQGSFGHIFQARLLDHDGLDAPVALKVFNTASSIQDEITIRNEIKFSMMLSKLASETTPIVKTFHAHTAKVRDVLNLVQSDQVRDSSSRGSVKREDPMQFCMSMELCEGGSLLDFMKEIETSRAKDSRGNWMREEEAARFLEPVAKALEFCHSHCLVHLDVKLANILLKEKGKLETACLADFGVAKPIPSNNAGMESKNTGMEGVQDAFYATPGTGCKRYMAPEVAMSGIYSPSADVFSLGCLLLVALTGFTSQSWDSICGAPSALVEKQILDGCRNRQNQIGAWKSLSPGAKQLILGMLCPDPLRRLSLEDVLRHPWLSSHRHAAKTTKRQGKLKKAITSCFGIVA